MRAGDWSTPLPNAPRAPRAASGSDPGRERENNEDRVLVDAERGIYAVIDGVGGESGGEVAAEMAREVLYGRLSRRTTDATRLIREAIALANKQIYERAQAEPGLAGMSCVLTVAVVDDGQATIGHVGDSRLYLIRGGRIQKVTRDHSPVGAREDAGEISEAEAMRHPRRNEIFRDVGSAPHEPDEEGFIETHQIPFDGESALLLCSDGLSDLVTAAQILERVEASPGDPQRAVRELIAAANDAGGKDNISVVLVEGAGFAARVRERRKAGFGEDTVAGLRSAATGRTAPGGTTSLRGAGHARQSALERLGEILGSRTAIALYLLAVAAVALWAFRAPLRPLAARAGLAGLFGAPPAPKVLRAGPPGSGLPDLGEALKRAAPGQTVEAAPGEYLGPIELQDGVSLVSQRPRGAVLHLPVGVADPVVAGEDVHDARFAGFRIAGVSGAPLAIGLRLADSTIEVDDVEIAGAETAGIEIAGADRSVVRYCYVHDNPGSGVLVRDQAASQLRNDLILRNGNVRESPRPGVEIRDAARPQLVDNRIEGNGAAGVWVPAADRVDEAFGLNRFGNLPRDKAVKVAPPAPAATPAAAPARPRRPR